MRVSKVAEPMYLMAAVVANPDECAHIREQLRTLPYRGPKLHWRELDKRLKRPVVRQIAAMNLSHLIVVAAPLDHKKQERARALCLERLCWELHARGVSRMVLESRTASLNQRDLNLVVQLRGKRSLPADLRVEIEKPSVEPMLWIPDQVVGAMGDAETGESEWIKPFRSMLTRMDIRI